nr:MAG TPA: hypothetical protein [Caudoviricetes sp.]
MCSMSSMLFVILFVLLFVITNVQGNSLISNWDILESSCHLRKL